MNFSFHVKSETLILIGILNTTTIQVISMQTKIRASLTLPSTNLQVIATLSRIEILMEFEIPANFFSNVGLFSYYMQYIKGG